MKQNHSADSIKKMDENTGDTRSRTVSIPAKNKEDFTEFKSTNNHEIIHEITPQMLKRILNDANSGATQSQAVCYRLLLEREPIIASHIQTRIQAVLSCEWQIQGKNPRKNEEMKKILTKADMYSLIRQLLDALIFGYAGAAILWDKGGSSIQEFMPVDPVNWIFDAAGNPALICQDGTPAFLSAYHPAQFIFFCHKLQAGHPARGGLMRPLLWLCLYKHYAMHDRARYLERYGIPFLAAKIRNEDFESEEIRKTVMESLSRMGSDGIGLLNEGANLQLLQTSGNGTGEYQSWLEYLDHLCTLMILGQTATSSNASGFSKGQIQENVRRDLLEADCRALMNCLNTQLIAPLEYYRYGTEGEVKIQLDYSYPDNLVEKSTIVKNLTDAGYLIDPDWIRSTFAIQLCNPSNNQEQK